jgi:hypothetical protein
MFEQVDERRCLEDAIPLAAFNLFDHAALASWATVRFTVEKLTPRVCTRA